MYGRIDHRRRHRGEITLVRIGSYGAERRRRRRKAGIPKAVLGFMLFMTVLLSVSLYGGSRLSDADQPKEAVGVLAERTSPEMPGGSAGVETGRLVMLAGRQEAMSPYGDRQFQGDLLDAAGTQDDMLTQEDSGPQPVQNQTPLIAIDPGHGGVDEGCSRGNVLESQVNMEIARRLEKCLQDLGFQTLLVRASEEETITMEDRVKKAEMEGADIYVSIHQNAVEEPQSSISGIETWYCQGSEEGRRLARLVHKGAVEAAGAGDRNVMETEELFVVRKTSMPACLIETGFLSNTEERTALLGEEYQEKLAKGIAQGIDLYFHPKTMYLTFDDGPSEENTAAVLDILKEKGIKATFFLVGENVRKHPEMAKRIVEEGHTIGVHCNRHVYTELYASVDSYLEDFEAAYDAVYEITGVEVKLFRFPGGSVNSYNKDVYEDIIKEMSERGFIYFDWNASLEDAAKNTTPEQLIANAMNSTFGRKKVVMLAHDIQKNTALCLEELLDSFPEYQMEPLTSEVEPIQFRN